MKTSHLCCLYAVFLFAGGLTAQEKDLGTETVTVVRPYDPAVADAAKIRPLPQLSDSILGKKIAVAYTIYSVPVASTFTPAKGRAAEVARTAPEKLYNTQATMGLGNYNNALASLYTSRDFDRGKQRLDFGLDHFSSRGEIEGTPLDADFYNTALDLAYSRKARDLDWKVGTALEHRRYHWYGAPENLLDDPDLLGADAAQDYFRAALNGRVALSDSYFREAAVSMYRFWDAAGSGENRLVLETEFELPVSEETFTLGVVLDYVGGEFENAPLTSLQSGPGVAYGNFQAGVQPSLLLQRDDLRLELGAKLVYGLDAENSESNFYIYPAVKASYPVGGEAAIAYGGVEGGLVQQSYYGFTGENPFVSPTLEVRPTDRQYEAYVGLRGTLLPQLSYNLKGIYRAENFLPLYLLNPQHLQRADEKGYTFGNSFRVFYDDVRTLGVFGELQLVLGREFTLGLNAAVNDYDTETDNPAWNLPALQASLFADYQVGEHWSFAANLFYVGERDDLFTQAQANTAPEDFPAVALTLDPFLDLNARVGYQVNPQVSVFLKGNNLAGNAYQRWANFRVQGLQVLAGVSYSFDW
ncbi:TonB-dependent receptor [Robiginitalea marina]|uniref:TonB-dependent receptor n=1 Tax=Robiginitalea marina TaxID=2954105 RepID=A0ABT1B0Y3_9FLAO|nr:TonB-dependent receptor [Robiginitalea marina]MCO5725916.1 TonB-dependent receptor [Robiginitalea marina]